MLSEALRAAGGGTVVMLDPGGQVWAQHLVPGEPASEGEPTPQHQPASRPLPAIARPPEAARWLRGGPDRLCVTGHFIVLAGLQMMRQSTRGNGSHSVLLTTATAPPP
jgi:hypothetical protein